MKKIFTLVVLLSAMMMTVQAQSVKFGFKGGLDVQKIKLNSDVFSSENKLGWFIGPTLQVGLPVGGLGVDISGFYNQKSTTVNGESIKQKYVLVPVNARYKLGLGDAAGIYVAAGPQFAFNVGSDNFSWSVAGVQNTFQLKKSAFSINLGAGIYLTRHFELGFNYNISVSSTADASWVEAREAILHNVKPKSWQISAAYLF